MVEYRNILAHISESPRSKVVLEVAAQLAQTHHATLSAVLAVEPLYWGAYMGPELALAAAQVGEKNERERVARAQALTQSVAHAHGMAIDLQCPAGDPLRVMTARARGADLVVLDQASDDTVVGLSRRFGSSLMVSAGCPVLFVPRVGSVTSCGQRVLVAWSPTPECARALRDALPILQRAQRVELLRHGPAAGDEGEPLDLVVAYLRTHGVVASAVLRAPRDPSFGERMLTPTVVDAPVAELLLSHAADTEVDLIVMGGFGHTRTYELLLGGVTRTILSSMTVPVLMSH